MQPADTAGSTAVNHPLALRMGIIAFLSQSISFGCLWGTFGVLLASVEARLGVGRALSSLPIPLIALANALLAPVVGILAGRISIRLLMMVGAGLSALGYTLLAATHSVALYIIAYGLLVGPGMCLSGSVLPSTLLTRWFTVKRGRALGFVHLPIMIAILPLVASFMLRTSGTVTIYAMLAALSALTLIPQSFIVDFPPSALDPSGEDAAAEAAAHPSMTTGQLLSQPRFWAFMLAMASVLSGQTMLGAHLVPMVGAWGISATAAASLLSASSVAGMAGALFFGWLADRIGGRMAMIVLCLDSIVLWSILISHPSLPVVMLVVSLIAFHGAAALPLFGMAVSQAFGRASFGRAFGLGTLASLPFVVGAVPIAAAVYLRTGSYEGSLAGHVAFFALTAILILLVGGRRSSRPAKVAA